MSQRYVLLDRDGTVVVEKHYLHDPDELEFSPGAVEGLKKMMGMGLGLVIVTNQAGVGRGYFGEDAVHAVNDRLLKMLAAEGIAVSGVYYCPHAPDDGCDCRKPNPGMAEQAARDLGFDPAQAFMIGDKPADIGTGEAVGATTILVRTGYGAGHEKAGDCAPDHVVDDLNEAAAVIAKTLTG